MVGGIFIGNVREYACNDGLQSFGDMKITCGPDGLWSKRNFECKSKLMCVGHKKKPLQHLHRYKHVKITNMIT